MTNIYLNSSNKLQLNYFYLELRMYNINREKTGNR